MGTGGMGKTTLATAALHHPDIVDKFGQRRYFVACESVNTANQLISSVGAQLGLEPAGKLAPIILNYFAQSGPAMLLLDNLETPWEAENGKEEVEEFLSLLTSIPHLALLVSIGFSSV
jgi:hypothetical protein